MFANEEEDSHSQFMVIYLQGNSVSEMNQNRNRKPVSQSKVIYGMYALLFISNEKLCRKCTQM